MKNRAITSVFCLLIAGISLGQGLKFDDSSYFSRSKLPKTRATLSVRTDLSSYTPISYPQFGGTCVAHSFSKALTILTCKRFGITNPSQIIQNSFSPYFIYYNLSPSSDYKCQRGLDIELVANFCLNTGQAKLLNVEFPLYYPFTQTCLGDEYPNQYPTSLYEDKTSASNFKFGSIYRADDIVSIKTALSLGMPVVGGFMIPESFQSCKTEYYNWIGDNPKYGHAMVIVGYDDFKYGGSIKLANSWGKEWGQNGYIWVPYNIVEKILVRGYACSDETNVLQANSENNQLKLEKEYIEIKIDPSSQIVDIARNPKEISYGIGDNKSKTLYSPLEYFELAKKK